MFKCKMCPVCNGKACKNQLPGMGGVDGNRNFMLNCQGWKKYHLSPEEKNSLPEPETGLAPMTGAVENVGYEDERQFYFDLLTACSKTTICPGIGDGTPDTKLQYGLEALKSLGRKASVFFKPYPDEKIYQRIEWSLEQADFIGIDIDSFNIVTMRNLVHLEKKTPGQLIKIKKFLNSKGMPFVIKGIFTKEDLEIAEEVKPDAAYVSNHGGRIDTLTGSTADFLHDHGAFLRNVSGQIWVDGGIRNHSDVMAAAKLGARRVLAGRPFATELCRLGEQGVIELAKKLQQD